MYNNIGLCHKKGMEWIDFLKLLPDKKFGHVELYVDNVDTGSHIFDKLYLRKVKEIVQSRNLSLSLHSIMGTNLGEKVGRIRKASIEILTDVMEAGDYLGAKWITTHLGSAGFSNNNFDKKKERLYHVIDSVTKVMEQTRTMQIKLGLENLPQNPGTVDQCYLGDCPDEMAYILNEISSDRVGVIFDLPHARIYNEGTSSVSKFLTLIGEKIIGIHLHWNNRIDDLHYHLNLQCKEELDCYYALIDKYCSKSTTILFECYSIKENILSMEIYNSLVKSKEMEYELLGK